MLPPTILLVDDDEDYLDIAGRSLQREGLYMDVHMAHTGAGALTLLGLGDAESAPLPNVVAALVDLNMPGLDGWEVLRRVRADGRLRWLPVIIVSSSGRAEDVQRSYELGANSYVVKQYGATGRDLHLVRAVRYWLEMNHSAARTGKVTT